MSLTSRIAIMMLLSSRAPKATPRPGRYRLLDFLFLLAGFKRHDLNRRGAHLGQETVDDGPVQQHVPARAGRLAEDDVSYPFAPGEVNERVRHAQRLELDHLGPQLFGETNILRQRRVVFGFDTARLFTRSLDVHGVPVGGYASGAARAYGQ